MARSWRHRLGRYPPGTSAWNRIEHHMFRFITMNWRGRPLTTYRTIIELISAPTTEIGLTIRAERDTEYYETAVKVSDKEMAALPLTPHEWHDDWNYTSSQPQPSDQSCGEPLVVTAHDVYALDVAFLSSGPHMV